MMNKDDAPFRIGQRVRIISGPFHDVPGKVAGIDAIKSQVRVTVNFWGRYTAVKLDYLEVEKI